MTDLHGQIAIVTGASGGLGTRFAEVLGRHGAAVALAARRLDRLEALEGRLRAEGISCASFAFDAVDPSAPDALVAGVRSKLGAPTILVNNAGISLPGRAHENTLAEFEQTMAVNLRAPWRLSQLCASGWIADKTGGAIVNIASMLSERVGAGVSLYCMSKAALRHMTASHALEWARHGIRVNAICPGYIRTEINDSFWETERGKAELARLPRRRVGAPQDLDSALLFLCDPASSFVNGAAIAVDDAQSWAV
ncbi:SDR family oxidoreductase [Pseudaminobacter arsenicus]|uniref:SDR family oxidoreductase n=1 Tax=Borborobacter arsenicus TaxID=1851146 RepID=A0A432V7L6_9HYPH|nr:SDR family oxidoreductase [Pseudaminobacter arsenicus]RUM98171.1 SDR family oxidoreductase [Pseudaminobacter arsenicus]